MYTIILFLSLIQTIIIPTICLIDTNLIESYFDEKSIKSAIIVNCYNKHDQLNLAKHLIFKNRLVSVLNIHKERVAKSIETNHQQIGVVLDGDCDKAEDFLITCGVLNLFDVKHHWLVISTSSIFEKFQKVRLHINADIHIAVKNHTQEWDIIDLYNPASEDGGELVHKKIGFCHKGRGYNAKNVEAKYWLRRNMTGVTFTTMVVFLVPYEGTFEDYLVSDENRTANTFERFQHKLLRFCRDYYNYTMLTKLGHSWGYPLPNGSFDGMVGALERKEVHFGSCPVFVRNDRMMVIDYGRNTWSWRAGFLFRSPKSRTSFEILFKPLSPDSWFITACFALISIVILKIVTTYERKKHHTNVETTWSVSVMFILGAFCQQGSSEVPSLAGGRITAISIFFLSLFIYQFYSASIVSSLLLKPTNKIKDLKDLTESSLKVGCEDIIYNKDLFAHTTDKIVKQLYSKKIYGKGNTSHFFTTKKGIELVRDDAYAFHAEVARAYPIIETTFSDQAICDLREVKLFKNTDLYNTYQKQTPLYDMLETCFQRLAENGILDKEKKHWHPRKPECIQSSQVFTTFNVGLIEFYPALLILLIGIVISLIILITEKHVALARKRAQIKHNLYKKKHQKS